MSTASAYLDLVTHFKQASLLQGTSAILAWDQETMMPAGGVEFRGEQLAQLAGLVHRLKSEPRLGDLLDRAAEETGSDPLSPEAVNVREWRLDRDRAMKLPESLVEELARVSSVAQHEWAEARRDSDFAKFRPWLEKLLELNRRQAECLGWDRASGEPWDALGDLYEPGLTAKEIESIFTPLGDRLKRLVAEIADAPRRPDDRFDRLELPEAQQEAFVRFVAESIGFDFTRGRLDRSTHPFCGGSHRNDVRLTTRFRKDLTLDALGSTMHECGHGIYEQGLPGEHLGTPMGEAASLSVHESQSRLWENQVGRSRPFWEWLSPKLDGFFGSAVAGLDAEAMYGAANRVQPGFIRVEADEATYNLHIMIRFDLERRMLRGDLAVADLPAAWNEHYREALGLEVPDDRRGCLQDVHWSMGAMGYFPTYTLGTMLSAVLFEAANKAIPGLPEMFAKGEFTPLRRWLVEHVHAHGRRHRFRDLCRVVTGQDLTAGPLLAYLEGKLRPLHGI